MLLGAGLSVSCDVGGEISSEFAPCAFERSPPHLFLYLLLFNKTKVETSEDSASCKPRGVKTFIGIEKPKFLVFCFFSYSIFLLFLCFFFMAS